MRAWRQITEVARRDFWQRARSKVFLVSTGITILLLVAIGPLLAVATGDPEPRRIGIVGEASAELDEAIGATAEALAVEAETRRFDSVADGEAALADGRADVVLVNGTELVWEGEPDETLAVVVSAAVRAVGQQRAVDELGLSTADAARLLGPPALTERSLDPPDEDEEPRRIATSIGAVALYISIALFGQFVLLGVMEEKASRVVEVLLAKVPPQRILAGKVIGLGLLGLLQLVVVGGALVLTLRLIDRDVGVDVAGIGSRVFLAVLLWFVIGYAFYSVVYGALGALISRQEDVQSVSFLPVVLMLPGYFISFLAAAGEAETLVRITSLVPPTSPLVMPARMASGEVPVWEVMLSVALIAVATYLLIRIGGRVYSGAILRIGKAVKLRDAWKAARS